MSKKKVAALTMAALVGLGGLTACSQAERASYNVSKDADNFKVERRLAVINIITGEPQLEMIGKFSILDQGEQLEVTVKTEDGIFKKHLIGLGAGVNYVVEDVSGSNVSSTRYQISYLPEAILPVELKKGN